MLALPTSYSTHTTVVGTVTLTSTAVAPTYTTVCLIHVKHFTITLALNTLSGCSLLVIVEFKGATRKIGATQSLGARRHSFYRGKLSKLLLGYYTIVMDINLPSESIIEL